MEGPHWQLKCSHHNANNIQVISATSVPERHREGPQAEIGYFYVSSVAHRKGFGAADATLIAKKVYF